MYWCEENYSKFLYLCNTSAKCSCLCPWHIILLTLDLSPSHSWQRCASSHAQTAFHLELTPHALHFYGSEPLIQPQKSSHLWANAVQMFGGAKAPRNKPWPMGIRNWGIRAPTSCPLARQSWEIFIRVRDSGGVLGVVRGGSPITHKSNPNDTTLYDFPSFLNAPTNSPHPASWRVSKISYLPPSMFRLCFQGTPAGTEGCFRKCSGGGGTQPREVWMGSGKWS